MYRFFLTAMIVASCANTTCLAQDEKIYAEGFDLPVFEQVDSNGVDLISGNLRVRSPTIRTGSDESPNILGMQWAGKSWIFLDVPTIWRKDGTFTVVYQGQSQEFRGRSNNYAEKKPLMGSKLDCSIWVMQNLVSSCVYTHRNGDVVLFNGIPTPFAPTNIGYGLSALKFGNLGMYRVSIVSDDNRRRVFGQFNWNGQDVDPWFFSRVKSVQGQSLSGLVQLVVTTSNHNSNFEEHYMRPKSTIQTISDQLGATWTYTFDGNRRMTKIDPPGGQANVVIDYYSSDKVRSVTNADGTWNYSYTTPGDMGTTTAVSPLGEVTWVKYHREKGYVTEYIDPLSRRTTYSYDSGDRLTQVAYPEGNYINFTYDARGNVLTRTTVPKPGGENILTEVAGYPTVCTNAVICNIPLYIIDENGARTDFEYTAPNIQTIAPFPGATRSIAVGTQQPIRILGPTVLADGLRPETVNEYVAGVLVKSTVCRTQQNCVGNPDAVVTTFDYGDTHATNRTLFGVAVSADGQSLTTCYTYDSLGRRQSATPPLAGAGPCPRTVVAALVGASPVIAGNPSTAPTYPDGSSGTVPQPPTSPPPPPPPPPGGQPPSDNCGPGTGIVCQ